jgi:hypothetical protein
MSARSRGGVALALIGSLVALGFVSATGMAAEPTVAPPGIVVARHAGPSTVFTATDLASLPSVRVSVSFVTEHEPLAGVFTGPLLWSVLGQAGVIDTTKPREQVRRAVLITGSDGYSAALSLGEIAPAFEGKRVIVAEQVNGEPLAAGHLRIIVPGDQRGGRSVRDVVRITVIDLDEAPH